MQNNTDDSLFDPREPVDCPLFGCQVKYHSFQPPTMVRTSLLSFTRGGINAARRYRQSIGLGYYDCVPHEEYSHISSGMHFFIRERHHRTEHTCLTFEDLYIAFRCINDYVSAWAAGLPIKGTNFEYRAAFDPSHAEGYIRRID